MTEHLNFLVSPFTIDRTYVSYIYIYMYIFISNFAKKRKEGGKKGEIALATERAKVYRLLIRDSKSARLVTTLRVPIGPRVT